jgi:hypothetical protein
VKDRRRIADIGAFRSDPILMELQVGQCCADRAAHAGRSSRIDDARASQGRGGPDAFCLAPSRRYSRVRIHDFRHSYIAKKTCGGGVGGADGHRCAAATRRYSHPAVESPRPAEHVAAGIAAELAG